MPLQEITYLNIGGYPNIQVLEIVKKRSKDILVRDPESGKEFPIPRRAVVEIKEAKK